MRFSFRIFFVLVSAFEDCNNFFLFFRAFVRYILQYYILGLSRVVCFQNSAQKSHLTMTGFSDPATNPNPSSGSRLNSTVLGSGTSFGSIGIHFRGSSQVVVLLRWLKILGEFMLIYVNVRVWFFGSFSHIRSTVIPRSFFWQWNDRISRSNFWLA